MKKLTKTRKLKVRRETVVRMDDILDRTHGGFTGAYCTTLCSGHCGGSGSGGRLM